MNATFNGSSAACAGIKPAESMLAATAALRAQQAVDLVADNSSHHETTPFRAPSPRWLQACSPPVLMPAHAADEPLKVAFIYVDPWATPAGLISTTWGGANSNACSAPR